MKKLLGRLVGKVANVDPGTAVDAFDKVAGAVEKFKFTGDNEAEFKLKRGELLAEIDKAQIALNASGRSSWRDAIGTACAVSFWVMFAINPAVLLLFAIVGEVTPLNFEIENWKDIINTIYDGQIIAGFMPVVLGLLGLGTMRSFDKRNSPVQGQRRKNRRAMVKARVKAHKKLSRLGVSDEDIENALDEIEEAA